MNRIITALSHLFYRQTAKTSTDLPEKWNESLSFQHSYENF